MGVQGGCHSHRPSLASQAKPAEAEPLYKRSLAIDEQLYGPDHREIATDVNNLAGVLISQVKVKVKFPTTF